MPLLDDLLTPIPGPNPAGENLKYAPVYDKIKEARRQDDDAPQGEWRRERKLADWPGTIKLITETLSKKTKDLQLAAWLTEAMLRRDGIAGLKAGLEAVRGLLETFWENVYPEIEDGDPEMRATPLQWIGDKLEPALKDAPLTRNGLGFHRYKESRAVGYEADVVDNEVKAAARQAAIEEGKITAEDFDAAFDATPKVFYAQLLETCDGILTDLEELTGFCDEKFGDVAPGFGRLRGPVEEVRQTVHILLQKKREREPDVVAPPADTEEATPGSDVTPDWSSSAAAAPAPARAPVGKTISGEPGSREDAVELVVSAARYIRREEPYSPVPYLMLRGLRWGELRANGPSIDPVLLDAPPGEIRQQLKRLALESNWTEVLETAETAMGLPCGRGWLDLQRYVGRACQELGSWYDPILLALKSSVRSLLQDFPDLPHMTMMDDTPAANAETLAWIKDLAVPQAAAAVAAPAMQEDARESAGPDASPDIGELALQAAAAGRPQEGIELLSREISRERSGRARFHRKVQLAQLCLSIGREAIAYPILNDLAQEIELRKLEEWEAPDAVAHPLALLFRCVEKLHGNTEEKQRLYQRICRLDPVQAMSCSS